MIRNKFRAPHDARWTNWVRRCKIATLQLSPPYDINGELYKECRDFIFAVFSGKCAYCEGRLYEQSGGEVEHFRPKGGIRDENNKKVYLPRGKPHPGYWWLAYDYRNLLPSCGMCNHYSKTHGGKGERFPVGGKRATKPGEEKAEKPQLLNPLVDDAEKHFDVDLKTGGLVAKGNKAQVTIKILGLNREALLEARRTAAMDATLYLRHQSGHQRVKDQLAGKLTYSFVWRSVEKATRPTAKKASGSKTQKQSGAIRKSQNGRV